MSTLKWELPKQKYLVGNADGIKGDCWRCCIAAILQLPAEEVPHFLQETDCSMVADTQAWLNARGYILWKGGEHYTHHRSAINIPTISCGPTIRSKKRGEHHAVVMQGWDLLYDPHPDDAGILYEVETYRIFKLP